MLPQREEEAIDRTGLEFCSAASGEEPPGSLLPVIPEQINRPLSSSAQMLLHSQRGFNLAYQGYAHPSGFSQNVVAVPVEMPSDN